MASDQFSTTQAAIVAKLEKLKNAKDFSERRQLLAEIRKLIADLERFTQGGRS
jgi:hypothetical protein